MYRSTADLYDAIYGALGKDYEAEAARLTELVRSRCPSAGSLLDVACGTGRHLEHLRHDFEVEGIDASPEMVDVARLRLPGTTIHVGDMRSFEMGRTYDAVTCLFSSIGYVRHLDGLARATAAMARHLTPSGVLVVEPWIFPDRWDEGHVGLNVVETPDLTIVRMNGSEVVEGVTVLDMNYLVGRPGRPGQVEHRVERHELALFSRDEYEQAFRAAGLTVDFDEAGLIGRSLFVGVRPSAQG